MSIPAPHWLTAQSPNAHPSPNRTTRPPEPDHERVPGLPHPGTPGIPIESPPLPHATRCFQLEHQISPQTYTSGAVPKEPFEPPWKSAWKRVNAVQSGAVAVQSPPK